MQESVSSAVVTRLLRAWEIMENSFKFHGIRVYPTHGRLTEDFQYHAEGSIALARIDLPEALFVTEQRIADIYLERTGSRGENAFLSTQEMWITRQKCRPAITNHTTMGLVC